jgi:hypothetical protein
MTAVIADPAGFRVLVTGSQDWADGHAVNAPLDELLARHGCLTVVHGACRKGADRMAHNWALNARHASSYAAVTPEPHPAIWRPGGRYSKTAGIERNALMVSLGADLCLAFIMPCSDRRCRRTGAHGSHGASHCARLAETAGIEVRRITPGGLAVAEGGGGLRI